MFVQKCLIVKSISQMGQTMSDNEYWDKATEQAYWDACAQEEAARREKDNELIPRVEARNLAYEIFNHFMYADFLEITPADIDEKVDAIPAVPQEMSAVEYLERECSPDYIDLHIPKAEAYNLILHLQYVYLAIVDQRGHDFSGTKALARVITLLKKGADDEQ
jgi:hypothetical protein